MSRNLVIRIQGARCAGKTRIGSIIRKALLEQGYQVAWTEEFTPHSKRLVKLLEKDLQDFVPDADSLVHILEEQAP